MLGLLRRLENLENKITPRKILWIFLHHGETEESCIKNYEQINEKIEWQLIRREYVFKINNKISSRRDISSLNICKDRK